MPGLVARFCYFTFPFANQARSSDFITEVFWSVVPGFFLQFIGIFSAEWISSYKISFPLVGALLYGITDDKNHILSGYMQNIHDHLGAVLLYNLFIITFSALLGFSLKAIVRGFRLDIRFDFFRFNNKWFYILSGEILDMDDSSQSSKDVTVIGLDILCKVGNENIIYIGELVNYYLTNTGDLDAVLIRYPYRRKLSEDKSPAVPPSDSSESSDNSSYYEIPSDYLYIPYRDVVNLNINYYDLK
jgi:hypothetical protein